MKRLTERYVPNDEKNGISGIKVFESENKIPLVKVLSGEYLYPAIQKLATYEDLEERLHKIFGEESTFSLADVIDTLETKLSEPDKKHPVNARILTYEEADKWEEYKNLEEQGLLVRLPCKVGEKLWCIVNSAIREFRVYRFDMPAFGTTDIVFRYADGFKLKRFVGEIGKTVFLTREEAEKKLEEMKNEI